MKWMTPHLTTWPGIGLESWSLGLVGAGKRMRSSPEDIDVDQQEMSEGSAESYGKVHTGQEQFLQDDSIKRRQKSEGNNTSTSRVEREIEAKHERTRKQDGRGGGRDKEGENRVSKGKVPARVGVGSGRWSEKSWGGRSPGRDGRSGRMAAMQKMGAAPRRRGGSDGVPMSHIRCDFWVPPLPLPATPHVPRSHHPAPAARQRKS